MWLNKFLVLTSTFTFICLYEINQIFHYIRWIMPKRVSSLRGPISMSLRLWATCPIWSARDLNLKSPAPETNLLPLVQLVVTFLIFLFWNRYEVLHILLVTWHSGCSCTPGQGGGEATCHSSCSAFADVLFSQTQCPYLENSHFSVLRDGSLFGQRPTPPYAYGKSCG